nr:zinc-dependent metalloprotease [Rubrivivax sp.]
PLPSIPRFLPDARSMLIGLHFSIAPLPDVPMATRAADPRIGMFSTAVLDFSSDLSASPRKRFVNRWRLEKKDPAAALSPPVKPITYWIDRNVPLAYRESVRAAILEWNKAFEKIGIQGAIVVEQQADDAKFDTLDFGYASVRWMMNASPTFAAIGPAHFDPRTGEILDADIAFEGMAARSIRTLRSQVLPGSPSSPGAAAAPLSFATPFELPGGTGAGIDHRLCMHGALAAEQLGYALDVLEAQGQLEPDSPIAQQFVQDYVKEAVMHEVGHTLGLRHNFRASRAYTEAQLADAEFTRAHGTTGSVMEYNAVNLPRPGQSGGLPFHTALGPYDYWAIEYAYKPMAAGTKPQDEEAELLRIAARSSEPLLAYGTDEDAAFGIDPETIQMDLGADPLAFAAKRLAIARDLFKRQESRVLSPQQNYAVLRRSIDYALSDVTRAVGVLVRQIGGVRTLRDFPGSGREPLLPVAAPVQRQALDLLASAVLSADGLSLSPALQRRLAPDYLDRAEGAAIGTDYSLAQRLLDLQRAVLAYLMSDTIAARILDSVGKFDRPADAFQITELYNRLSADVWGDFNTTRIVDTARRELQRDHVNRLAAAVLRPMPGTRVDTRSQVRAQARTLLARLDAALKKRGPADADTSAHLADCADTLRQALAAPLQRLGL